MPVIFQDFSFLDLIGTLEEPRHQWRDLKAEIVRRKLAGETYTQIASALHIARGTVSRALHDEKIMTRSNI
jgi:DNA invertase Pin-like site-specific DNA recombinase